MISLVLGLVQLQAYYLRDTRVLSRALAALRSLQLCSHVCVVSVSKDLWYLRSLLPFYFQFDQVVLHALKCKLPQFSVCLTYSLQFRRYWLLGAYLGHSNLIYCFTESPTPEFQKTTTTKRCGQLSLHARAVERGVVN